MLRLVISLALIIFYVSGLFGTALMISRIDQRMSRLFDISSITADGLLAYINQLMIAERVVFWHVGWEVFNDYPWLGVGLGNSGYFYRDKLSGFGMELTETNQILYRETYLPNTKALWSRLLAETGLLGFAFFTAWLFLNWSSGQKLKSSVSPLGRTVGLASQLVVMGLLVEGFSVDTFALPYFWFLFGLSTAAWKIST